MRRSDPDRGLLTGLAACNTVAGVGDDVSGGARTVQSWF